MLNKYSGYKILFVDDEEQILQALTRTLREESYKMLKANSGQKALDILTKDKNVHVIISDYRMPKMNGVEFFQKAKEICPHAIRVVLSGYADSEAIIDAVNKGEIYRFEAKPWDDRQLKLSLSQYLDHYILLEKNRCLQEQTTLQNERLRQLNKELEELVELHSNTLTITQEILNTVSVPVIGVDYLESIVLCNQNASSLISPSENSVVGALIDGTLPESIVKLIRNCLYKEQNLTNHHALVFNKEFSLELRLLNTRKQKRGCILIFYEVA